MQSKIYDLAQDASKKPPVTGHERAPYPQQGIPSQTEYRTSSQDYSSQQGYSPQQFSPAAQPYQGSYGTIPPPNQYVEEAYADSNNTNGFAFTDESIRRSFIRKVYSLLSVNEVKFKERKKEREKK